MEAREIATVVSDLDGTLIESEQVWEAVRRDFVVEHHGRWTGDAQKTMIGMRTEEWARFIHDRLGVRLPPERIAKDVVSAMVDRMGRRVPVLPGARAALERLAGTFQLGLATSASRAVAEIVLDKTGWRSVFSVVVSADEVPRGKPAPDVYLRAVELLKASAIRTAALEDSANGIRSAHAAGLAVVAIPNRAFPPGADALTLADCVVATLEHLDAATISSLRTRER